MACTLPAHLKTLSKRLVQQQKRFTCPVCTTFSLELWDAVNFVCLPACACACAEGGLPCLRWWEGHVQVRWPGLTHAVLCCTGVCRADPSCAALAHAVLCGAVRCCAALTCAVLCCAVLCCCAVSSCTVIYCEVLCLVGLCRAE